jgi:hypothetical protein
MSDERDQIVTRYVEDLIAKVGRKPTEQSDNEDNDDDVNED